MPSLSDITQAQAVRAFVRLGGVERPGKGSHRVINFDRYNLSIPRGPRNRVKEPVLRHLIKLIGITEDEFLANV